MTKQRSPSLPLLFAAGYLVAWSAAGVVAFAMHGAIDAASGDVLDWNHAGRWVAGTTLLVAAVYQWTPLKDACLAKCRSPLGFLLGEWRDGPRGALSMGTRHGAWCVACCWALMAALFALGIMSITWMAVVAACIAIEKMVPWRGVATHSTATILLVLGALVLLAPSAIPGLTTPSNTPMQDMPAKPMMGS